jgi:hypothetical protein
MKSSKAGQVEMIGTSPFRWAPRTFSSLALAGNWWFFTCHQSSPNYSTCATCQWVSMTVNVYYMRLLGFIKIETRWKIVQVVEWVVQCYKLPVTPTLSAVQLLPTSCYGTILSDVRRPGETQLWLLAAVCVWQGHQLQATPRLQIVKLKMVCLWPLRLQELRIHDKMGWLTSEMSKWLASVSAKTVLPTNPYSLWGLPTIDSLQDPSLSPVSFCGCHMWNDCYCRAHGGHLLTQVQSCTVSALSHANAQGLNIWFLLLGAGSGSPKRWKHLIKVVWIGLEREFMGLHHVLGWTPCRLRWVVNQKLMRASGDLDRLWAATSMVYRLPAASRHNFSQLYKLYPLPGLFNAETQPGTLKPGNPFDRLTILYNSQTEHPAARASHWRIQAVQVADD